MNCDTSLKFLLGGMVFLLPLIIAYTAYSYWVFRGRQKKGRAITDDQSLYETLAVVYRTLAWRRAEPCTGGLADPLGVKLTWYIRHLINKVPDSTVWQCCRIPLVPIRCLLYHQ